MTAKAELIKRALGGHHLSPFLPGGDHKAARSTVVSGGHGWGGGKRGWGHVTPKGIEQTDGPRGEVVTFISWKEVFDVVAKGATPERVERYRNALAAWSDHHRRRPSYLEWSKDNPATVPYTPEWQAIQDEYSVVTDELHAAQNAIIDAGCEAEQTVQIGESYSLF